METSLSPLHAQCTRKEATTVFLACSYLLHSCFKLEPTKDTLVSFVQHITQMTTVPYLRCPAGQSTHFVGEGRFVATDAAGAAE